MGAGVKQKGPSEKSPACATTDSAVLRVFPGATQISHYALAFSHRHAQTTQFFTMSHGARRGLKQNGIRVSYLGQSAAEFTSQAIRANRFRLTLRNLQPEVVSAAQPALDEVAHDGVPNYFDDQR